MAASVTASPSQDLSRSGFGRLATRVGRHSMVYALAAATSIASGLLSIAVLTRYLTPSQFGNLAVLLVSSSILTLVYNAGSLQGTFSWVFGAGGEDGEVAEETTQTAHAPDRRRGLGTGFAITFVVGGLGTAAAAVFASPLAGLLLGDAANGRLILWTAAGAALASAWRLAVNTIRLERRPWTFLLATGTQHVLGIVIALPLLAHGLEIEAAVAGIALGNGVSLLFALALIRHSVALTASWFDATRIMRSGRAWIPVVVSFNLIQLADVLLLAWFAAPSQVGLYRVASRVGALVSYWTTSFHMAWGSMRGDASQVAAIAERGTRGVAAMLASYFSLVLFGLILAVSLVADETVALVAPGYESAADLVPLTAAGFAFHGWFVLVYRCVEFPGKRGWFATVSMVNAAVFVVSALIYIPAWGAAGAPAAVITGWSVGILTLAWRGQSGVTPVPFEYGRLTAGLALATALYLLDQLLHPTSGVSDVAVDLVLILAYPLLLIALRVVPRAHVQGVVQLARSYKPGYGTQAPRDSALTVRDYAILKLVLRRRIATADVARLCGLTNRMSTASSRKPCAAGSARATPALAMTNSASTSRCTEPSPTERRSLDSCTQMGLTPSKLTN